MKIAIVFWSGTGNTEEMANAVAEGVKNNGAEAVMLGSISPAELNKYDAIAFGCPAMGAEELEDGSFEPMFSALEGSLNGKKIALFGFYGWGDGEWMRTWEDRCKSDGAVFACNYVIANEAPNEEALEACRAMGAALTK
ncbi:MAG: flavodoxin [Anaerolineaceae bacterium]|nr:flavodoxin [Anaerolineaceae bacterium]